MGSGAKSGLHHHRVHQWVDWEVWTGSHSNPTNAYDSGKVPFLCRVASLSVLARLRPFDRRSFTQISPNVGGPPQSQPDRHIRDPNDPSTIFTSTTLRDGKRPLTLLSSGDGSPGRGPNEFHGPPLSPRRPGPKECHSESQTNGPEFRTRCSGSRPSRTWNPNHKDSGPNTGTG